MWPVGLLALTIAHDVTIADRSLGARSRLLQMRVNESHDDDDDDDDDAYDDAYDDDKRLSADPADRRRKQSQKSPPHMTVLTETRRHQ